MAAVAALATRKQFIFCLDIVPSVVNWLLCALPRTGRFLREAGTISARLGSHALRVAIKDETGNRRVIEAFARASND
jgi:histidinol-phosphate/aromatic aminotransferase/cobyric acid decarboxylase-like protein